MCAGGVLVLFCTMGMTMTGFTVYQPFLISMGGLSNTESSMLVTIRSICALCSMLGVTWFYRRVQLRAGLTFSVGLVAASFALLGAADSYLGYAVAVSIAGISYGLGGMFSVSVLINQWFVHDRGLALGICSAATGASTVVLSPLVTWMVHRWSLDTAFFAQAVGTAVIALIVGLIVRGRPHPETVAQLAEQDSAGDQFAVEQIRREVASGQLADPPISSDHPQAPANAKEAIRLVLPVCVAMFLLGGLGNTVMAHVSVLYATEGFSAQDVSILLSTIGVALVVGKIIYGKVVDRFGGYASNYVFFALALLGNVLCSLAGVSGFGLGMAAMIVTGVGLPLATVGISVYANDLSKGEFFTRVLQVFQILYMVGSMVFGFVPGVIADHTGSYVPFFVGCIFLTVICAGLIQVNYLKVRRIKAMAY
jgi:MFS family permease